MAHFGFAFIFRGLSKGRSLDHTRQADALKLEFQLKVMARYAPTLARSHVALFVIFVDR